MQDIVPKLKLLVRYHKKRKNKSGCSYCRDLWVKSSFEQEIMLKSELFFAIDANSISNTYYSVASCGL